MAKKFSILLFTDENSPPVKFRLAVRWLWGFGLLLAACIGGMTYLGYSHISARFERQDLVRLQAENNAQRRELAHLTTEVGWLKEELGELAVVDARLRQLAGNDAAPADVPVAVGGLPETDSSTGLDPLEQQINDIQMALEARRHRQEEVRNLLNDRVSLSRATPRGWPTKGWLTSYFGKRISPLTGNRVMHEGLDIAANTGTPVYATADGVVARVSYTASYGKAVVIDHGYGYRTIFGHNSKILVNTGDRVRRGDRIALVGNTGRSTGPHLHYELRLDGVPIDPRKTL